MRTFKWHGIPVNIPNKKIEWQLLAAFLVFEFFIIIVLISFTTCDSNPKAPINSNCLTCDKTGFIT